MLSNCQFDGMKIIKLDDYLLNDFTVKLPEIFKQRF